MAEPQTEIHPGSFVGDTVEEFKKLPTWGKLLIGAIVIGVAGYALYVRSQSSRQSGPNITGSIPTTGQIPSGASPVYDPNGNIIGYTNPGGNGGSPLPPTPTPTPTPTPAPGFQWPSALQGMKIWQGTVSHNFFFGPQGPQPHEKNQTLLSTLFPSGTIFSILPNGDFAYQLPGGQVVDSGVQMTNGNPPGQNNAPLNNAPSKGLQNGPNIQSQVQQSQNRFNQQVGATSAPVVRAKLATHTVQPGETIHTIAAKHHVPVEAMTAANTTPIQPGQKLVVPRGGK